MVSHDLPQKLRAQHVGNVELEPSDFEGIIVNNEEGEVLVVGNEQIVLGLIQAVRVFDRDCCDKVTDFIVIVKVKYCDRVIEIQVAIQANSKASFLQNSELSDNWSHLLFVIRKTADIG